MTLPFRDEKLLPRNTACDVTPVAKIWWERIKKDDGNESECHKNSLDYTCRKSVCREKVARESQSWEQYRSQFLESKKDIVNQIQVHHDVMLDQEVKPLLMLGDDASPSCVSSKLKLSEELGDDDFTTSSRLQIRFNVFRVDNKPFRKTDPGDPFFKVVVCGPNFPVPSLSDVLKIKQESRGKSVKIAVVNFGKVVFYSLDALSIPLAGK